MTMFHSVSLEDTKNAERKICVYMEKLKKILSVQHVSVQMFHVTTWTPAAFRQVWPIYVYFFLFKFSGCSLYSGAPKNPKITVILCLQPLSHIFHPMDFLWKFFSDGSNSKVWTQILPVVFTQGSRPETLGVCSGVQSSLLFSHTSLHKSHLAPKLSSSSFWV